MEQVLTKHGGEVGGKERAMFAFLTRHLTNPMIHDALAALQDRQQSAEGKLSNPIGYFKQTAKRIARENGITLDEGS